MGGLCNCGLAALLQEVDIRVLSVAAGSATSFPSPGYDQRQL